MNAGTNSSILSESIRKYNLVTAVQDEDMPKVPTITSDGGEKTVTLTNNHIPLDDQSKVTLPKLNPDPKVLVEIPIVENPDNGQQPLHILDNKMKFQKEEPLD